MREETDALMQSYVDGTLADDDAERLLRLIEADAELKQRLLDNVHAESRLRKLYRVRTFSWPDLVSTPAVAPPPERKPSRIVKAAVWLARHQPDLKTLNRLTLTVVALMMIVLGVFILRSPSPESEAERTETTLRKTRDAVWVETPRQTLDADWLHLLSGLAQIDFACGAKVVLDGKTDFHPVAANRAVCTRGRLTVHVPPKATGFRIDLPQIGVVDLGTEFFIDASNENESLIRVVSGRVALVDPDTDREKGILLTGESAVVRQDGTIQRHEAADVSLETPLATDARRFLARTNCRIVAAQGGLDRAAVDTLDRICAVVDAGVSACRLEVLLAADRTPIVSRRLEIKQSSKKTLNLERATYEEIHAVDASIPRLQDVLPLFRPSTACRPVLYVRTEGMESELVAVLREAEMLDAETVVASDSEKTLKRLDELAPSLTLCLNDRSLLKNDLDSAVRSISRKAHYCKANIVLLANAASEPKAISKLKTSGLEVWAPLRSENEKEIRSLVKAGTDGLLADRPVELQQTVIKLENR